MPKFHQTNNLERILEVQEDKKESEEITEEQLLKLNLEDLKKKYKRDNRELYHEAIKHNHRKMSDSGKLKFGYCSLAPSYWLISDIIPKKSEKFEVRKNFATR